SSLPMPELITEEQLKHIYRETIAPLYRYASRRCGGDRPLAEDVTQEVWLRAVREWRRSGLPRHPWAWLLTTARNLFLNELRRRPAVSFDAGSPAVILAAI